MSRLDGVVVALDKFKGSATAVQACTAVRRGFADALPGLAVAETPIADGGEGTVEVLLQHGFEAVELTASGPSGRPCRARYAMCGTTAVLELAEVAGLHLLDGGPTAETALDSTTRGLGELIADALDRAARRIVVAVGGSATTDGGVGALVSLGARIERRTGAGTGDADCRLDLHGLDPRLREVSLEVASDVDNPLTGLTGAAHVYGPQKGAGPLEVALLDRRLTVWADTVRQATGRDLRGMPGAGAAGGTAFGLAAVLRAQVRSGIDFVLETTGLRDRIDASTLVIVGEGSLDAQSLRGKGPVGIAREAARAGARVVAVVGQSAISDDQARGVGIDRVYALTDLEPDRARCMTEAPFLLEQVGRAIAQDWLSSGLAVCGAQSSS